MKSTDESPQRMHLDCGCRVVQRQCMCIYDFVKHSLSILDVVSVRDAKHKVDTTYLLRCHVLDHVSQILLFGTTIF
jgi:hypothetical protein